MKKPRFRWMSALIVAFVAALAGPALAQGANGRGAKKKAAAPLTIDGWTTARVVTAASGGTLVIEGVVKVEVPAGAVSEDTVVSVRAEVVQVMGQSFLSLTFGPTGSVFARPLKVTASTAILGRDRPEDTVWYHAGVDAEGAPLWTEAELTVDESTDGVGAELRGRKLIFYVDHFSRYGLGCIPTFEFDLWTAPLMTWTTWW